MIDVEKQEERAKVAYLSAYRDLMLEINIKEERLARIDSQLYSIQGQRFTDEPKGGGEPKGYAEYVAIKVDLYREINRELLTAQTLAREIEAAIANVPSRIDRLILEMRHIDCMTYEEIAERLAATRHNKEPYSVKHVTRMYWAAVGRFSVPK